MLFGVHVNGRVLAYYFVFVVSLVLFLALLRIVNSPFGRVLQAIRENAFRAEAIGYRVVYYRTLANVLSAGVAALAGVLIAIWLRYTGPATTLSLEIMIDVLLIVVIGGMGTMYGAVVGATHLHRGAELSAEPHGARRGRDGRHPDPQRHPRSQPLAALARPALHHQRLSLPDRHRRAAARAGVLTWRSFMSAKRGAARRSCSCTAGRAMAASSKTSLQPCRTASMPSPPICRATARRFAAESPPSLQQRKQCPIFSPPKNSRGVTLVGWSMGAHVAYSLLQGSEADRISQLVVVDMTPKVLNDADWHLGVRSGIDAARSARAVAAMRADWPRYAPHVVENMFAPGGGGSWRGYACAEIAKNDGALMASAWESLTAQDFRAFLPAIAVPTLIAYGGKSRIYAEDVARYQAAAIPGARIVRFDASGHSPHLEEAERFTEMLRDFCR